MFDVFKNAWKVEDIREKLLYTLLIIVIFRLGAAIPVPFLDTTALSAMFGANSGNLLGYLNMLTGGALSMATVFAEAKGDCSCDLIIFLVDETFYKFDFKHFNCFPP